METHSWVKMFLVVIEETPEVVFMLFQYLEENKQEKSPSLLVEFLDNTYWCGK